MTASFAFFVLRAPVIDVFFIIMTGKLGQKLSAMNNRDFNSNILKFCRGEILSKEMPKKQGDGDLLKSYSPW